VAEAVELIEPLEAPTGSRSGVPVVLREAFRDRFAQIVDGGAVHVLTRVHKEPPQGVRTKRKQSMMLPREEVPPQVVRACDRVQGTAWRINRAVLAALDTPEGRLAGTKLRPEVLKARELVLGEAKALASLERFHFAVFLDFRGRLYQHGGLLTYTSGSDLARGLLEFADGERLNSRGIGWLTWHAAQMWGDGKDGKDPAPDLPLGNGTSWRDEASGRVERWHEAEHPAQFLAAALAIQDDAEGRAVHLPVRVDATCSGLQHLALLARDADLAPKVNLWGECHGNRANWDLVEAPREGHDFYDEVAEAAGPRFTRGEAKAVIVPLLYGAGVKKCAKALAKKRRGEDARLRKDDKLDAEEIRETAKALAPKAFKVLKWFKEVAKAHNGPTEEQTYHDREGRERTRRVHPKSVEIRWTTPSGFKAVQDYRYVDKNPKGNRQVKVRVNGRWVNLVKRFYTDVLDPGKQVVALPSSIVHSMDASLLTEIVATASIDQWAVAHDAFCAPANHLWKLVQANEDAMRFMYSPDRLAEWAQAWRAVGVDVPNFPERYAEALPAKMLGGWCTLG
jgi:DNA-directed RNA polymerase